ncbi:hypothetical protein SAMN04489733_8483 [Amycolatopsis keratiniphila]|nr:hypothetical protein SAMN04489733_8483 [Amycolatopsis keratiniphila]
MLIDGLSSTWGVRNHADHKTVWVELTLHRGFNRPRPSRHHLTWRSSAAS